MHTLFQRVNKSLRFEGLPVRVDATKEAIPIRLTHDIPYKIDIEHLKAATRRDALVSLINYKDVCVCPVQCRFFSLYGSNFPYFATSMQVTFSPYHRPERPRNLYVVKECALRVKGFRTTRLSCPFKSVRALSFEENSEERTDSRLAHAGVTEGKL